MIGLKLSSLEHGVVVWGEKGTKVLYFESETDKRKVYFCDEGWKDIVVNDYEDDHDNKVEWHKPPYHADPPTLVVGEKIVFCCWSHGGALALYWTLESTYEAAKDGLSRPPNDAA